MRLLNRIVLTVGLALTVASQAGAVTISLLQIGGTYNGISAVAGDTLTLDIEVTLGSADAVTLVDPALTFGAEVTAALPGGGPFGACPSTLACETSFNLVNGVPLLPIVTGTDIGIIAAGQLDGWEGSTLNLNGAPGPFTFSLGQATFTLSGADGTIAVGAVGLPFGTIIGGAGFVDITGVSNLGFFEVGPPSCAKSNPTSTLVTVAKGQGPSVNDDTAHNITGHIVGDASSFGGTANRIPVCAGRDVSIVITQAGDAKGPATIDLSKAANLSCDTQTIPKGGAALCEGAITQKTLYIVRGVGGGGSDTDRMTLLPF